MQLSEEPHDSSSELLMSERRQNVCPSEMPFDQNAGNPRSRGNLIALSEWQEICPCALPWVECPRLSAIDITGPDSPSGKAGL